MSEESFGTRFWRGFTQPSITALASASASVMLCGALTLFGAGPWMLTDGRVRTFAADDEDDAAFVTARVWERPEAGTDTPTVYLVGGSGLRESLTSTEALEDGLIEASGREVDVVDLTMDGQTLVESAGLAAVANTEPPGIVVLGLSPVRMQYSAEAMRPAIDPPRLGIRNDTFLEELAIAGVRVPSTGWPLLDASRLYLPRLPTWPLHLVTGGTEQRVHAYLGVTPQLDRFSEDFTERLALLEENFDIHAATVKRLVERARDAGHTVLIYEGPLRTDIFGDPLEPTYFDTYAARSAALKDRLQVEVVSTAPARLQPTDFADPVHLNNADAQSRVTETVIEQLTPHIRALEAE